MSPLVSVTMGLLTGVVDGLAIMALGVTIEGLATGPLGAPPWIGKFAWPLGLACWVAMVAVQLLLTPVLAVDRIRLIMVALVGGLAAWWVARYCQKAATRGDTPVNPT